MVQHIQSAYKERHNFTNGRSSKQKVCQQYVAQPQNLAACIENGETIAAISFCHISLPTMNIFRALATLFSPPSCTQPEPTVPACTSIQDAPPPVSTAEEVTSWKTHLQLADSKFQAQEYSQAIIHYRLVISLNPTYNKELKWPAAHWQLGAALAQIGHDEESLHTLQQFVKIDPNFPDAYGQIGMLMERLGRDAEAADYFQQVIDRTKEALPNTAFQAAKSLVNLHTKNRSWATALSCATLALQLNPGDANIALSRASLTLLLGDYENGFAFFHETLPCIGDPSNPEGAQFLRNYLGADKCWDGADLGNKSLLLWSEHGLGDSIMMIRYVLRLAESNPRCRIQLLVPKQLIRLFSSLGLTTHIQPMNAWKTINRNDFDKHCSLMSLPYLMGTKREGDIPRESAYLKIPDEYRILWAERLEAKQGLKIGLVWAGNPHNIGDTTRSIPLSNFLDLMQIPGTSWISLQKGAPVSQIRPNYLLDSIPIIRCDDMLDTAALISNLDVVISVDTAVAHLAGALGCKTWLLNRCHSEWRWLLDRQDSPWYPTMKIFRQTTPDNWQTPLAEIADNITSLLTKQS